MIRIDAIWLATEPMDMRAGDGKTSKALDHLSDGVSGSGHDHIGNLVGLGHSVDHLNAKRPAKRFGQLHQALAFELRTCSRAWYTVSLARS